jgi:hypothetical protein
MDSAEVQICSIIVLIVFSLLADLNTYPLQTLVETFVRADGAFIPFAGDFNMNNVTTTVKGVGEVGDVHVIDLQAPINSLIGRQVVKVGRSSGLTTGTIMAYALEYNDEKGICFFTDFLVVGENQQTFDLEGDSGSLILLWGQDCEKPRPVGIIWGGTANRGRLKLKVGLPPENWTSGVDLGRLLDLLELDLITTNDGLQGLCFQFNPIFFSFYINALTFRIHLCFSPHIWRAYCQNQDIIVTNDMHALFQMGTAG